MRLPIVVRVCVVLLLPLVLLLVDAPTAVRYPVEVALSGIEAVRALGPAAGWRCLTEPAYRYAPPRDRPDRALVADLPEVAVATYLTQHGGRASAGFTVETVEVNLRSPSPSATVVTRAPGAGGDERRAFRLQARGASTISMDLLPDKEIMLCYAHIGDWRVIEAAS